MHEKSPTHLDLCTGIGGFSIAAQAAGFRTIGFSEIDPYDCRWLRYAWPEIPNLGDIKCLTNSVLKSSLKQDGKGDHGRPFKIDLITSGFPCQPYSLAGKRKGHNDSRYLWPEVRRLVKELHPAWFLGENVAGLASMVQYEGGLEVDPKKYSEKEKAAGCPCVGEEVEREGSGVLDTILADIEEAGYEVLPFIIPACAVDAPHRRDRVWIIAHSKHDAGRAEWGAEQGKWENQKAQQDPVSDPGGPFMGHPAGIRRGVPQIEGSREHQGSRQPAGGSGGFVSYADGPGLAQREGEPAREELQAAKRGRGVVSNADDHESYWRARHVQMGWREREKNNAQDIVQEGVERRAQSGLGGLADGLSGGLAEYLEEKCLWPVEPMHIPRIKTGVKFRKEKIRGYGNAIVPQVAYQILVQIRCIMRQIERLTCQKY